MVRTQRIMDLMKEKKYIYFQNTTSIPHFYLSKPRLPQEKYIYDYTYYYDWLRQRENVLAEYHLSTNSRLILTNKVLCIKTANKVWGESVKILPLKQITDVETHFQRLLLPLIIGGIVAPLSMVGFFLHITTSMWLSFALSISGIFLMYYGWVGTYQLKITAYHSIQFNYFIDFKSTKLDEFMDKVQKVLSLHKEKDE